MRKTTLLLLLAAGITQAASGQYYDRGTIQKNFETTDFFFTPSWVNPFGLDGFGPAVAGVVGDRLLDLQLSPSLARGDAERGTYAYLDFRGARQRTQPQYDYRVYALADDVALTESSVRSDMYYPYPGYWQSSYRLAEPVMTGAVFTRPAPSLLPGLTAGFTYSLVTDDQAYYEVPSGIYRNAESADAAASAGVPITDIYSGSDQMHTIGHFPSLIASYEVSPRWNVGARLAIARFNRDGEFGNFYSQGQSPWQNESVSSQFNARNQEYRHTDLSIGVDGQVGNGAHVGASLGRLSGTGTQYSDGGSLYRHEYGTPDELPTGGSIYRSGSLSDGDITRDGSTTYGSVFLRRDLDQDRRLTLAYRGTWSDLTLSGSSLVTDSSYSFSQSMHRDNLYRYEYAHDLYDSRTGEGEGTTRNHRISAGLEWTLSPKNRLVLGAVGTHSLETIDTREDATVTQWSYWENQWNDGSTPREELNSSRREEVKEVQWTFSHRRASLQVPIMLWHTFSEHFELVAGVTRRMTDVKIADETLALFDHRYLEANGRETTEANFGERYREPTEYATEVATSLLVGLTASPAPNFDIRLLASPQWSSLTNTRRTQWWLGFQLRP
ncbi:MAG: hypothetical protein HKN29_00665 [Rhodothermales bacterium]|nr:hypothetical protein [Rhodothermales bacterium]